jgi:hypothetical protein
MAMMGANDIQRLIEEHTRRLQKLREQQARFGVTADPHILTEIEDIKAQIEELRATLAESGNASSPAPNQAQSTARPLAPSQGNQGIIVSGGTFNANLVAVGANSRAIQETSTDTSDLQAEAEAQVIQSAGELLRELEQYTGVIESREDMALALRQIAEEAGHKRPNTINLKSLLVWVKTGLGSEASFAPHVQALQSAVELFIGLLK